METLILAIIITWAIKKAAENSHLHWQGSKSANRRHSRGRAVPSRAADAARHDAGYWAHQVRGGFPQVRQGLLAGWHSGRIAQLEGAAARAQAKTEHVQTRVRVMQAIREQRRRQAEAMEEFRRQWQEEGSEGSEPAPVQLDDGRPSGVSASTLRRLGLCPYRLSADATGSAVHCGKPLADGDHFCPEHRGGTGEHVTPPEQAVPGGDSSTEKGTTTMASDVTYDGVIRRMQAACNASDERVTEVTAAKAWANATADEMQALNVDAGTLGAMADYLEALDRAEKALQAAAEAAQSVQAELKRGHAGLAEAHANAPVQAADREFYEE